MPTTRSARRFALALLAFLAAPAALAQHRGGTVELTPFAGASFGGRLYPGSNAIFGQTVDVSDEPTYGLRLGFNMNKWLGFEIGASRTEAHFERGHRDGGLFGDRSQRLGDLELRQLEGTLNVNLGRRRVVPYLAIGGGATQFRADVPGYGRDTDTRFTAVFGGGLKFWVTPRFAFRLDARGRSAYVDDSEDCFFEEDDFDFCDDRRFDDDDDRRWYTSGEVTGGLTIAF